MRLLIGIFAAILLVSVALFVIRLFDRFPERDLSATFRGWGDPLKPWPSRPTAFLEFTNPSSSSVRVWVHSLERQAVNEWIQDDAARVAIHVRSGQTCRFLVPVPTTNAMWRVTLRCQEQTRGRFGNTIDEGIGVVARVTGKPPEDRYSGRVYYVTNEIGRR